MPRGKFVVLDGGEGSGKSTLMRLLADNHGYTPTREPGGSMLAEDIRSIILQGNTSAEADAETMFGLFWAARRDHIVKTVIPALDRGETIICDRFDSSTWAYQICGQEQAQLIPLFHQVRDHYIRNCLPNLYIIFDIEPIIGLRRAHSRTDQDTTHFDKRELDFHNRVREGFLEFVSEKPHKIVDASKSLVDVYEEVSGLVKSA